MSLKYASSSYINAHSVLFFTIIHTITVNMLVVTSLCLCLIISFKILRNRMSRKYGIQVFLTEHILPSRKFLLIYNLSNSVWKYLSSYSHQHLNLGNSLAVQWLGLNTFPARGRGSIPSWGTKIPRAMRLSQKKKKKIKSLPIFTSSWKCHFVLFCISSVPHELSIFIFAY